MAIKVDRINGQNYAENIVDNLLLFDSGTWNIASGTGTATLDTNNVFAGDSSLKVQNNTPIEALTATNSVQSTIMPSTNKYHFSFYVKKDVALEVISGAVLVYRNAVLADTQSFTIGNGVSELDENDTWIRYQNDKIYSFDKGDDITFQFRIDSLVTTELTTKLYFDGVMMNLDKRNNTIVPLYNKPNSSNVSSLTTWNMLDKSAAYSASFNDFVASDATSAAFTVTLPTVSDANKGKHIIVKKIDSSANIVTVSGGGGLIDNASTISLSSQFDTLEVVSSATGWYII